MINPALDGVQALDLWASRVDRNRGARLWGVVCMGGSMSEALMQLFDSLYSKL
jgi:hypothetical protein